MSSSRSSERARQATSFAVSSALPPPIETTASTCFSWARATAASTTCAGGSATTSSNTVSSAASARLASAAWVRPAPRTPLSVTKRTRRAPNPETSPAIFWAAPGSKRTLGVVWKVNGVMAPLRKVRLTRRPAQASFCRLEFRSAVFQFLDENACVLGVIDRHVDEMHPAEPKSLLQRRHEVLDRSHARAFRPIGLGIAHEVRIAEGQAIIREVIHRLLPPDHAIG